MKATAPSLIDTAIATKSWAAVFCELIKARLTFLVLLTTLAGIYLGQQGDPNYWVILNAMAGTALVAFGAAALNQYAERDYDALMRRTEERPLPSGRLQPATALIFGGASALCGLGYLAATVNLLTCLLGAISLVSYVFVYTPLKRLTSLNTAVGAIPGALPPLMGWVAVRGEIDRSGWALFAILFFWQLAHFLAIGWMYREDYGKAGFVMLPVLDREGHLTGRLAVCHCFGLMAVSLAPTVFGITGTIYGLGAVALGVGFTALAVQFARRLTNVSARQLFYGSILYLPLLLILMLLDKTKF